MLTTTNPIQADSLLDFMSDVYEDIAEKVGQNVPYTISMNGSLYPSVVCIILGRDVEPYMFDDCRFLAENEHFLPARLSRASNDRIASYIHKHEQELLSDINDSVLSDKKEYECYG